MLFDNQGFLNTLNLINYDENGTEVNSIHFNKIDPATSQVIQSAEFAISDKQNTAWPYVSGDPDKCWMIVDPQDGTIYIAWSELDDVNGGKANIYFTKSTDGVATFSPRVLITNDEKDNFYVQLAVLANGNVLLLWDVRGEVVIKSSVSADKGATFSAPQIVFTNPSPQRKDELMALSLAKHQDASLILSLSILGFSSQNDEVYRSLALRSSDGVTWQPNGNTIADAMLTSAFSYNGSHYTIGYSLTSSRTGFYLWKLTANNTWEPYTIKTNELNGVELNAGDYVGSVLENGKIYSAFTWEQEPGGRKVYVTETTL